MDSLTLASVGDWTRGDRANYYTTETYDKLDACAI